MSHFGLDFGDLFDVGQMKPPTVHQRTSSGSLSRKSTFVGVDRLKNAKLVADEAIRNNKIFTIQGPYPAIREGLRRRGWVEKFYNMSSTLKSSLPRKKSQVSSNRHVVDENNNGGNDDDDDDDDLDDNCDGDGNRIDLNDHGGTVAPWEEENGFYGITSRLVRNATPQFIWVVRREVCDPRLLAKEQMINHYGRASFTTKVGLCTHLRNLPWYQPTHSNVFFPRCYRLSHDDDKQEFIDDFFLTACISLLRHVSGDVQGEVPGLRKKAVGMVVPKHAVEIALTHCRRYLQSVVHDDIDQPNHEISESEFETFINWYYQAVHKNAKVDNSFANVVEISEVLSRMKENCPQYEIDGTKNVWIVKPGAKSRGRGIQCYNCLDDMLKLVSSQVARKEGKFVVQKYIERPLLIYRTKFDIRQWFLVTDWNPLTMWFYKNCYLRFCSQEYTLNSFDESIHLSNNSIQKNYRNGERASELPDDNMWTNKDFHKHIQKLGLGHLWDDVIYPGMKNAVIGALLCCQDDVEHRKSTFELYGADFMLDESYRPWLIEINSSPCMAPSTKITAMMCNQVLEDTIRVVLDRKLDKNADTGLFELAYKQPSVVIPHYIGINLQVDGTTLRSTDSQTARRDQVSESTSEEPETPEVVATSSGKRRSSSSCDEILGIKGEKWETNTTGKPVQCSETQRAVLSDRNEAIKLDRSMAERSKKPMVVQSRRNGRKRKAGKIRSSAEISSGFVPESQDADNVCLENAPPIRYCSSSFPCHVMNNSFQGKMEKSSSRVEGKVVEGDIGVGGKIPENQGTSHSQKVIFADVCTACEEEKVPSTMSNKEAPSTTRNEGAEQMKNARNKDKNTLVNIENLEFRVAANQNKDEGRTMKTSRSTRRKFHNNGARIKYAKGAASIDVEGGKQKQSSLEPTSETSDCLSELSLTYQKTPFIVNRNGDVFSFAQAGKQQRQDSAVSVKWKSKMVGTASGICIQGSGLPKTAVFPSADVPARSRAFTEFPLALRSIENSYFYPAFKTFRKGQTAIGLTEGLTAKTSTSFNVVNYPHEPGAIQPVPSFSIKPWRPADSQNAIGSLSSDSWRTRVALSLYAKSKNPSTYSNGQKKFALKYTNSRCERSSFPQPSLPVGLPTLVSRYIERSGQDGPRRSFCTQHSPTPHLSIVAHSFNNW